jgi:micrococcal nuclease
MAKHVIYGAFGLAAAFVIAAAIYFDPPSNPAPTVAFEQAGTSEDQRAAVAAASSDTAYEVSKVIDGDTIIVKIAGEAETVRLIGIDAPETGTNGECFATEATQALKSLLAGERVTLEKDSTQGERDKYDRLLAYVFTESGANAAEELIRGGFAKEYTYNKTYTYQKEFKAAQKNAQDAKRGLWAPNACAKPPALPAATQKTVVEAPKEQPATVVEPEPEPEAPKKEEPKPEPEEEERSASGSGASGYTCSANTYNCSDFATHAEAQAVYEQCGGASNDVHKLDSNKDGEACESLP